jgi:hypothetical protein
MYLSSVENSSTVRVMGSRQAQQPKEWLMRRNTLGTFSFILAALALSTLPADADPITAVYDVQVLERFFGQGGELGTEEFHRQFTVSMTFDPARGTSTSTYGPASFSSVPLQIPSPPADLALESGSNTTHRASPDGGFLAGATAGRYGGRRVAGIDTIYFVEIRLLSAMDGGSQATPITPETFPIHLGTLRENPIGGRVFNFIYSSCLGIGPFPEGADSCTDARTAGSSHVAYFGRATWHGVDVPPIPEPTTVVLVGSGLAIGARCKHLRRERKQ